MAVMAPYMCGFVCGKVLVMVYRSKKLLDVENSKYSIPNLLNVERT